MINKVTYLYLTTPWPQLKILQMKYQGETLQYPNCPTAQGVGTWHWCVRRQKKLFGSFGDVFFRSFSKWSKSRLLGFFGQHQFFVPWKNPFLGHGFCIENQLFVPWVIPNLRTFSDPHLRCFLWNGKGFGFCRCLAQFGLRRGWFAWALFRHMMDTCYPKS